MTDAAPTTHDIIMRAAGWEPPYAWTKDLTSHGLTSPDMPALQKILSTRLREQNIEFPDEEALLRRCIAALFTGHVVLQGPPGTGKTTLARALAEAFQMQLVPSTATSEWSPFHVVGGLRPNKDGGLVGTLGVVPAAVLDCARRIRAAESSPSGVDDDPDEETSAEMTASKGSPKVGSWLLIDEFNRADIDRAIGSLYTLLSSCEPAHLAKTPIDLWFEDDPQSRELYVPSSFRVIGTMNDLDTSYVSPMSQGLRRRFQFITIGVPLTGATQSEPVSSELFTAYKGACASVMSSYSMASPELAVINPLLGKLQRLLDGLRRPVDTDGWPVGTAQVVDVIKAMLILGAERGDVALDEAVAHRLLGQLNSITSGQHVAFRSLFEREGLTLAVRELKHLYSPFSVA